MLWSGIHASAGDLPGLFIIPDDRWAYLPPPSTTVVSTWVFGHVDDARSFTRELKLHDGKEAGIGFIQLKGDSNWLEIALVQRPTIWTDTERFCSEILPAAIFEFYQISHSVFIENLDSISVTNEAEVPEIGCRCYTRVMLAMGLNFVNGEHLSMKTVPAFCKGRKGLIQAFLPDGRIPRMPPVTEAATRALKRAQFVTTMTT